MCFNVNFRLLKTIYVHLFVCYLNSLNRNKGEIKCQMLDNFVPSVSQRKEIYS